MGGWNNDHIFQMTVYRKLPQMEQYSFEFIENPDLAEEAKRIFLVLEQSIKEIDIKEALRRKKEIRILERQFYSEMARTSNSSIDIDDIRPIIPFELAIKLRRIYIDFTKLLKKLESQGLENEVRRLKNDLDTYLSAISPDLALNLELERKQPNSCDIMSYDVVYEELQMRIYEKYHENLQKGLEGEKIVVSTTKEFLERNIKYINRQYLRHQHESAWITLDYIERALKIMLKDSPEIECFEVRFDIDIFKYTLMEEHEDYYKYKGAFEDAVYGLKNQLGIVERES